jgi:hypothetical protein
MGLRPAIIRDFCTPFGLFCPMASAAGEYESWNAIVDDVELVLDEAHALYLSGAATAAKEQVNTAYFSYYEKVGDKRYTYYVLKQK